VKSVENDQIEHDWIFGIFKNPKKIIIEIYYPTHPWNISEIITASVIIFFESFIFIFTAIYSWKGLVVFSLIFPQTTFLFISIFLPVSLISKNFKSTIIWHAILLIIPSIICLIILLVLKPMGLIEKIVTYQMSANQVVLILLPIFGVWILFWKFYAYMLIHQKNENPHLLKVVLLELSDIVVFTAYVVNFFILYLI
jgi:hypothetical protein